MFFFNFLLCVGISFVFGQPEVKTKHGILKGATKTEDGDEYIEFLGVPYARPPVGKLRFQKPEPVEDWAGVKDATGYGRTCTQAPPMLPEFEDALRPVAENDKAHIFSEDCLTLNIYYPGKKADGLRSVMVWVHGGGFVMGASWWYQGWRLALHGDVIVVTFNYRLGVFGFLSTGDGEVSENNGMWDQLMALQWVQDNIDAFGGDRNKVTIFGESAGGASVSYLSLSPKSRGLFQRVIMQSGTALSPWALTSQQNARKAANRVAENLSCNSSSSTSIVKCLMNVKEECLMNASLSSLFSHENAGRPGFTPTVDTEFLPLHPNEILTSKSQSYQRYGELDVIAGALDMDGAIFSPTGFGLGNNGLDFDVDEGVPLDFAINETKRMGKMLSISNADNVAKAIEKMYFSSVMSMPETAKNMVFAISDETFIAPTVGVLNHHNGKGNTYLYYFTYSNVRIFPFELPSWVTGAFHADDLPFVFGLKNFDVYQNATFSDEDKAMENTIMTYWTNFAKTGNPTESWPMFTASGTEYMELGSKPIPRKNFLPERMDLWLNKIPVLSKEKQHEEL